MAPAGRTFRSIVLRAVGAICLACILVVVHGMSAARAAELRRVLLLQSFGPDYSPWGETATSLRAELFRLSPQPIDLYETSVFTARLENPWEEGPLIDYLRGMFSASRLDLIIAVGTPAVRFAQRNRPRLFPATPLLMTGMAEQNVAADALTAHDTVAGFGLDLRDYVANILRVLPDTNNIMVVVGNSSLEQGWRDELRGQFAPFADRVSFTWTDGLSLAEIARKAADLPPRSAILHFLFTVDGAGVPHVHGQALAALREVADAPIFGFGDYELGHGIVGGPLAPTDMVGRDAAGVAIRILGGESPGEIVTPSAGFGPATYDWRELTRWNISEAALPPDSIVRFRPPGMWEQYRWQIAGIAAVLFAQTSLIVYGLVQGRRRRRAETSLAESEERMTFTAASINVGLWHYTRATDQFWITEHCRTLFRLVPGEPFTRASLLRSVHSDDKKIVAAMLTEPSDGGTAAIREFRIVLSDHEIRWIRTRTRSSGAPLGMPDKVSGVFIDLTDIKAAQTEAAVQRLELAHLMRVSVLGELSGAIAHELNQPLTAILSNAQAALHLLAGRAPDLAEVRDALGDIVHEDNRAGEVIKRIRGFLRKDAVKTESIDINDLVDATVALLHSELIARRIAIDLDLARDLPTTLGDPVQVQQVILNVVMNAMDAMAATPSVDRRIAIATRVDRHGLIEVSIRDRGHGIKPADERRLFEPFYTTKQQGLGLGLALCSTIVEAHGGHLTLGNHPDGGAVATFALPAEQCLMAAQ